MKKIISIALILFSSSTLAQNYVYVTDKFEITMRTGQGTQHKIVKTLGTGSRLEFIESDDQAGYTLIRTKNGVEGWVLSRYLVDQPVAKDRLIVANARNKELSSTLKKRDATIKTVKEDLDGLQRQHKALSKNYERTVKELERVKRVSAKELKLHEENKALKTQTLNLQREIQTLEQDNMKLEDQSSQTWFMYGAILCVIGIFLGLVLPRMKRGKSSWGSL
jgi:SH3 domain protein